MKQTVTLSAFRDAFRTAGRADNFSYSGLEALYDYLTEMEESTGEEIELDPIAICCEFNEASAYDCASDLDIDAIDRYGQPLEDDELADAVEEYLNDAGVLVWRNGGTFIYHNH